MVMVVEQQSLNELSAQQLREMATLFLDRKEFSGPPDVVVSDEMAEIVELTPLTQADWRTILAVLNELARQ